MRALEKHVLGHIKRSSELRDKLADMRFGARESPQFNIRDVGLSSVWGEEEGERSLAQATFEANTADVHSEISKHGSTFSELPFRAA